jgi:hypothetical protein
MRLYEKHQCNDGQLLFNKILLAFALTIKVALKALVYSPLLFLGWVIAKQILTEKIDKILWIAVILLFAVVFYFIVYFFKGAVIALKHNKNLFWIPLFVLCVLFTCVLPVWIVFGYVKKFFTAYSEANNNLLTWIFACAFGLYVYSRYHFLTNIAPTTAYPYYQSGINMTMHLLNFSNSFKARKSQDVI